MSPTPKELRLSDYPPPGRHRPTTTEARIPRLPVRFGLGWNGGLHQIRFKHRRGRSRHQRWSGHLRRHRDRPDVAIVAMTAVPRRQCRTPGTAPSNADDDGHRATSIFHPFAGTGLLGSQTATDAPARRREERTFAPPTVASSGRRTISTRVGPNAARALSSDPLETHGRRSAGVYRPRDDEGKQDQASELSVVTTATARRGTLRRLRATSALAARNGVPTYLHPGPRGQPVARGDFRARQSLMLSPGGPALYRG